MHSQPDQIISLPKPARSSRDTKSCLGKLCLTASRDGFLRKSSSAISGFRSLCGREQHSSSYCAQFDLRFGTFHSAGSRFENSGLHPLLPTGPATLDRCCGRNVVVPGEYSKGFFCVPIGLYLGILRKARARGMPARSAFGGLLSFNPTAAISPRTSPFWPWPTSTTRVPPGASSRIASGAIAR